MSNSELDLPPWMKHYSKQVSSNSTNSVTIKYRPKSSQTLTKPPRVNLPESAEALVCSLFWQIAEFTEKLLLKADKSDIVIGFDIDWTISYKTVLSKISNVHIVYDKNKCCFLKLFDHKKLPKSLLLLLKHPNVKLAGYNLSEDLTKLGKDFGADVNQILEKLKTPVKFPEDGLFCSHNWDLESATENLSPNLKGEATEDQTSENTKKEKFRFTGKLKYSNHHATCAAAAEELLELADAKYSADNKLILGFDLEWPFSYKSGSGKVALIQICTNKDICYLLHIPRLHSLPKTLVLLLNHKYVKLVGVNIANDIRKIGRDFKIETKNILENNIVELGTFANEILHISERWSLDRLVLHLLGLELEKPVHVRCSDWSQDNLSGNQLMYAASDAYAGLAVYNYLNDIKKGSIQQ